MVNINGLWDKAQSLKMATEYLCPDVIIGCESKVLDKVTNAEVLPPGYQKDVFRKDRDDRGGGIFLAFREGYVVSQIENSNSESESVWAEVAMPNQSPLTVCSFYRPPNSGSGPIKELNRVTSNSCKTKHT